jgi:N6-adenosine-specific RNA methylase IME4
MLAEADTIQKAKELKDLAITAADWAKRKKMGSEAIEFAQSYGRRAEIRLGELLCDTERAKGGNPKLPTGNRTLPVEPTLAELGITKNESSEAQTVAQASVEDKEAFATGEISKTVIRRKRKEANRESRRKKNRAKIKAAPAIASIETAFSAILIDPPWDWGDEGDHDQLGRARPDYATMTFEQILALPLQKLSDTDCHLYMWITNRSMPKGFSLLEAWGFRFITVLTWPKKSFGMGNYFRGQTEHILFGVKGSQPLKRKNASTLLPDWNRGKGGHSSKPTEIYEFVESCSPGPYLEMFGRGLPRPDWIIWGE